MPQLHPLSPPVAGTHSFSHPGSKLGRRTRPIVPLASLAPLCRLLTRSLPDGAGTPGAIEAGEADNIFAEEGEAKAAAHSAYESLKQETGAKVTAASAYERRRGFSRGFAAMFL
jgi:hypothetical protein